MLCEALRLVWLGLLDELGRYAAPYLVFSYYGASENESSGSHYGTFPYDGIVEHRRAHADECAFTYGAGMYRGVVTNRHVVFNHGRANLVGNVYAGAVLHVHPVAEGNRSHVASEHSVKPYRAFVAHCHFAHDSGVLAEIAVFAPFRSKTLY